MGLGGSSLAQVVADFGTNAVIGTPVSLDVLSELGQVVSGGGSDL